MLRKRHCTDAPSPRRTPLWQGRIGAIALRTIAPYGRFGASAKLAAQAGRTPNDAEGKGLLKQRRRHHEERDGGRGGQQQQDQRVAEEPHTAETPDAGNGSAAAVDSTLAEG